ARDRIAKALDRLEQQVQRPRGAGDRMPDQQAAEQRWDRALRRFCAAVPADLHEQGAAALEDERCPLWGWIESAARGRSRLPRCLTEAVMRRLVLIRLDQAGQCGPFEAVCLRCGLQYPEHKRPPLSEWKLAPGSSWDERPPRFDLPRFFEREGCPACGGSGKGGEMNWAHLIEDGYWFAPGRADKGMGGGAGAARR